MYQTSTGIKIFPDFKTRLLPMLLVSPEVLLKVWGHLKSFRVYWPALAEPKT